MSPWQACINRLAFFIVCQLMILPNSNAFDIKSTHATFSVPLFAQTPGGQVSQRTAAPSSSSIRVAAFAALCLSSLISIHRFRSLIATGVVAKWKTMDITSTHHPTDGCEGAGLDLTLMAARRLGARLFSSFAASSDTEPGNSNDEDKLLVYIESACETDGTSDDAQALQDELGSFLASKLRVDGGVDRLL
eukprot:TRINITY_DN84856_c0_g1_i1.p1 TRINITY_DN84856_c0_g1~~TRINITY_DN84856_c0_g1_i1.p1  ORF type:complete len:191 (-),score=20.94 TRINITY_DN84856_c0_g1_i1:189-761(-)